MAKGFSFPNNDAEFSAWLSNFAYKLTEYTNILEIDYSTVIIVADVAVYMVYLDTLRRIEKAKSAELKKILNQIGYGNPRDPVSGFPPNTDLGTPPATPTVYVKPYLDKLIQIIINHPNYTQFIGQDLEIV